MVDHADRPGSTSAGPPDEPQSQVENATSPGWREVLTVGAVVVAVVLSLAVLTSVLPTGFQEVVFHTPLAIAVLLLGTVGLLLWVARRPSPRL